MHESDDINSILNAVNEINEKPKKEVDKIETSKNNTHNTRKDLPLPPDVDKIITEAKNYKKKFSPNTDLLILNEESSRNQISKNKTFEEIQNQIIEDLYSKLAKRVKKHKSSKIK
jgi:hypothetical protein